MRGHQLLLGAVFSHMLRHLLVENLVNHFYGGGHSQHIERGGVVAGGGIGDGWGVIVVITIVIGF